MKCRDYFSVTSMKEGNSAPLSGRGRLHGGAGVVTLVILQNVPLWFKIMVKSLTVTS